MFSKAYRAVFVLSSAGVMEADGGLHAAIEDARKRMAAEDSRLAEEARKRDSKRLDEARREEQRRETVCARVRAAGATFARLAREAELPLEDVKVFSGYRDRRWPRRGADEIWATLQMWVDRRPTQIVEVVGGYSYPGDELGAHLPGLFVLDDGTVGECRSPRHLWRLTSEYPGTDQPGGRPHYSEEEVVKALGSFLAQRLPLI